MSEHPEGVSSKKTPLLGPGRPKERHSLMGKVAYRVRIWKTYSRALINRGNLTLWFSEDVAAAWHSARGAQGRGHPFTYSDTCIELALTLRNLFQFPLRATQGFLEGLIQLMKLELPVPSYSQLSRRAGRLQVVLPRKELLPGFEWVECAFRPMPAPHSGGMSARFPEHDRTGGHAVIPPRTGTCIVKKNPSPGEEQRNRLVRERRAAGGKKAWKKSSGYPRRSLVETHMFRLKTILGDKLHIRSFKNQETESRIMAAILNKMTAQGMPESCKIAA